MSNAARFKFICLKTVRWGVLICQKACDVIIAMTDESAKLSAKARARALEPINKMGYMDGASDGQNATFQSSFDTGYEQGFRFGLNLGCNEALAQLQNESLSIGLNDPRRINCQMCLLDTIAQENVVNLFNIQKEKNDDYLSNSQINK